MATRVQRSPNDHQSRLGWVPLTFEIPNKSPIRERRHRRRCLRQLCVELQKCGAGDGNRTRTVSLGIVLNRSPRHTSEQVVSRIRLRAASVFDCVLPALTAASGTDRARAETAVGCRRTVSAASADHRFAKSGRGVWQRRRSVVYEGRSTAGVGLARRVQTGLATDLATVVGLLSDPKMGSPADDQNDKLQVTAMACRAPTPRHGVDQGPRGGWYAHFPACAAAQRDRKQLGNQRTVVS